MLTNVAMPPKVNRRMILDLKLELGFSRALQVIRYVSCHELFLDIFDVEHVFTTPDSPTPDSHSLSLAGSTGLFLGGPFLGAISGASAYYVASNNDGPIGDAARNTGDWAVKTGAKVGETVREADERHNIFDQVQNFFSNGWQRVCQLDQEHKASERVKETVSEVGAKTIEFERNHHFMENTLVGIQKGIDFVLEKLKGATNNENSNAHSTNS
ncbi:hypothetical protein HJC23_013300 [Cyclotella cryptica]|uniref:Uncharacterized protein n=1 Tax=Cyclotella cryptica TaxID=29204 RepID=A0ABD3NMQ6_9STRA